MNTLASSKQMTIAMLVAVLISSVAFAQHLNTGALGTNQDAQLVFANANAFVLESGFVGRCVYTNGSTYAGHYGIGLSPTTLPRTVANGGPISNAPALGSYIQLRIESVAGPAGGAFSFWDRGATSPSVSLPVGAPTTSVMFALSDQQLGAGFPGADPFGHIHGRRFTVNKAGNYTVGFKAFDTSTNGLGNGPIHTPSEVLQVNFNTAVALAMKRIQRTNGSSLLTIHQGGITNVFVETTANLAADSWDVIAGPFTNAPFGPLSTTTLLDTNADAAARFYRLRGIAP
jgi:hypothetical protein